MIATLVYVLVVPSVLVLYIGLAVFLIRKKREEEKAKRIAKGLTLLYIGGVVGYYTLSTVCEQLEISYIKKRQDERRLANLEDEVRSMRERDERRVAREE